MIISFKHKFIFIKSRKTGGTSVQVALSSICGEDDIITGELIDDTGKVWESYGPGKNTNKFFTDNPHPTSEQIKNWLESNGYDWNDFFKFTIIRHPLDLIVSRYHWDIGGKGKEHTSITGFRMWLPKYLESNWTNDFLLNYTASCQFILRYENLDSDFKELCTKLNLTDLELLNLKGQSRTDKISFWHYYSNFELEMIYQKILPAYITGLGYDKVKPKQFSETGERKIIIQKDKNIPGLDNINGPCVIKSKDLYYLYYAHHQGKFIRLASTNDINSTWNYIKDGKLIDALNISTTICEGHIASPDVHKISGGYKMYFHGDVNGKQKTYKAISDLNNPTTFRQIGNLEIGEFYFRYFEYHGKKYGISKKGNKCGIIYVYDEGRDQYKEFYELIPNMRHASIWIKNDFLFIFYTRIGDLQEHIRYCKIKLNDNILLWDIIEDEELLFPKLQWEGAYTKKDYSRPGAVYHLANQLRDPFLFEDNDKLFLFYSYGGEYGIAYTELKLEYI